jgi:hypothetical protein
MKQDAANILREALKLPPEARAALAGTLLDSLDDMVDEDAEAAWQAEILNYRCLAPQPSPSSESGVMLQNGIWV